ncbi:16S rRNA (guanine(1516)-N(2))-methyltransferase RsmJ [Candidatus Regiella insecticola]|nr:16S rRNA (guanine(1516)-N(2))-methyltransferase RsmJ [Candidatus Regiella insecticola]
MSKMNICLLCEPDVDPKALSTLAERWGITSDDKAIMALVLTPDRLELRKRDEKKLHGIYVDFVSGTMAHRRCFGGGRSEAVAKAVGIKKNYRPTVVDATAGLGRDAFVLASLGCNVKMLERHPVVAALLDDGLQRGYQDAEIGLWLRERMTLLHASSFTSLLTDLANTVSRPDVVYLDPMYPPRAKSALVKKEMRIFQSLVGADEDADNLLAPACALALKRVVVKRPAYAPPLAGICAQARILTKNHRFDLYLYPQSFKLPLGG